MAAKHRLPLKRFLAGGYYISLENIHWLFSEFLNLESLECSLTSSNVASILEALSDARSLRSLKLWVSWLSTTQNKAFTSCDAFQMMSRDENSKLRSITINDTLYNGEWVADHGEYGAHFQVFADVVKHNVWLV